MESTKELIIKYLEDIIKEQESHGSSGDAELITKTKELLSKLKEK